MGTPWGLNDDQGEVLADGFRVRADCHPWVVNGSAASVASRATEDSLSLRAVWASQPACANACLRMLQEAHSMSLR